MHFYMRGEIFDGRVPRVFPLTHDDRANGSFGDTIEGAGIEECFGVGMFPTWNIRYNYNSELLDLLF